MPSRSRDPQEQDSQGLKESLDSDTPSPQTVDSGRPEQVRKAFSPSRLEPISSTQTFRKRSTTLRLPALHPDEPSKRSTTARLPALDPEAFRKRSTTLRLPALDLTTFSTRTTLPRVVASGQEKALEEEPLQPPPAAADLWLIAGPERPNTFWPQHRHLPARMRVQLILLVLALLALLGMQGFAAHLAGECVTAQLQGQQNCLALSMLPFSTSQANATAGAAATSSAALPAIPRDLPDNVYSFIELALPYAAQAHQTLGWPLSVVLAQWGLEHGWSVPDAQGYNWGNTEYAPGCPYAGSRFCYADTPAEGLREYIYTAQLPWYDGVRAAVPQGADATALALGESPWDAGHYGGADHPGSSLLAIMRSFNLYRFDVGG